MRVVNVTTEAALMGHRPSNDAAPQRITASRFKIKILVIL